MDAKDYNGPGLKSGRKGQKSPLSKLGRKHVEIIWENNMSINALFGEEMVFYFFHVGIKILRNMSAFSGNVWEKLWLATPKQSSMITM